MPRRPWQQQMMMQQQQTTRADIKEGRSEQSCRVASKEGETSWCLAPFADGQAIHWVVKCQVDRLLYL
jgi:hypothetical protein